MGHIAIIHVLVKTMLVIQEMEHSNTIVAQRLVVVMPALIVVQVILVPMQHHINPNIVQQVVAVIVMHGMVGQPAIMNQVVVVQEQKNAKKNIIIRLDRVI